jgi:hypothetical protein
MSIEGHGSPRHPHVLMEAKHRALNEIAAANAQPMKVKRGNRVGSRKRFRFIYGQQSGSR